MSQIGHDGFREAGELPIPEDVRPGPGWTEQMLEMADHIGPYRTLLLVDRFGGRKLYIPADPAKGKSYEGIGTIADVIGPEGAEILSHVYRREYLKVPVAKLALGRARRQAIVAAAREGSINIAEAARRVGTTRPYMSHLVNQTDEGTEAAAEPRRSERRDPRQTSLFDDEEEA